MHLAAVGLSQHRTPLAIRERLAVGPTELPAALAALGASVLEGFVLSTCNRVEVYALAASADEARGAAWDLLVARDAGDAAAPGWTRTVYCHEDVDAVRHLFRVASGLDSMVLGEEQISGQLRAALDAARRAGLVRGTLGQLGAAALTCGKRVRAATGIGRQPASMVSVGLREVERALGGWAGRQVVIVGAGQTAQLAVKHLAGNGGPALTVIGRTAERVRALATRHAARARPFAQLTAALAEADALVTCTAASHHVVLAEHLAPVARRSGRALICLDLGVPRDIDPVVARLPGVTLIDVDRVQVLADLDRREREREVAGATALLEEEVERCLRWWRAREVIPAIAEVHAAAEAVRDAEVARAVARLSHLPLRDRRVVEALARRLVAKLLHPPTAALRATGDRELAEAARRLFAPLRHRGARDGAASVRPDPGPLQP